MAKYPKGQVLDAVKRHDNLDIICCIRHDTKLYDKAPPSTGKRGRPRKRGERITIKDFDFEEFGDYFVASRQVIAEVLGNSLVTATFSTKDKDTLKSPRLFLSTIPENEINALKTEDPPSGYGCYLLYKLRWGIEVLFYEHKSFWSLGKYMVRSKKAIERFVNLMSIAFAFVTMLPYTNEEFVHYRDKSAQEIKYELGEQLMKELIFKSFVKTVENDNIYPQILSAVKRFLCFDKSA